MSRLNKSIKNMYISTVFQVISIIMAFVSRTVFISILSVEYLGISGLFTNILTVLSLAELGVGAAIIFSLYKPLADDNIERVRTYLNLYKKLYRGIALSIGVIGLCIIPMLHFVINENQSVENVKLIYLLFLGNSVATYFYSYNHSLLIADQKLYIVKMYTEIFKVFTIVVQILILYTTKNFIYYLIIQIIGTLLLNFYLYNKVLDMYPFMKSKTKIVRLEKEDKKNIIKNIKAMFFHRLGTVLVFSTDNIIISTFLSLKVLGVYSNYTLIIRTVSIIIGVFFESLRASIGNYVLTKSTSDKLNLFWLLDFIAFNIFLFCSICLINLLTPFILDIWIRDDEYLFSDSIVSMLVLNFFLSGLRANLCIFKDVMGLFVYDQYKPIAEAFFNLIVSIILVKLYGLIGVLIGTILTTLVICYTIEPFIVFHFGFKLSCKKYYAKLAYKLLTAALIIAASLYFNSFINSNTIIDFIMRFGICCFVFLFGITIFYFKTTELKDCLKLSRKFISKF
jgi:O-antigen/teichoic acid export membrane protein